MKTSKLTSILVLAAAALATQQAAIAAQPASCDRACLIKLAEDYLGALVAHDTGRVPLAGDVKVVENAKRIKAGEGLWSTASDVNPDFKIIVPDPVSQQVGGIVMMQSGGKPAQVGFRLKLVDGRLTEVENMIAMTRDGVVSDNLKKLRPAINMEVPYEYADSRGRLIHIAKSYYDALDLNNGHLAPFASDCERRENGFRTAPNGGAVGGAGIPGQAPPPPRLKGMNDCTSQLDSQSMTYITTIDQRRVEIADEVTGLALGFSHFRHPMTPKDREYRILNEPGRETMTANFDPFDLPALHIYKIWGGQIHEIEAMGFMAPLNSPTGWE